MVSAGSTDELKSYLESYMSILSCFYRENKLVINEEYVTFLVMGGHQLTAGRQMQINVGKGKSVESNLSIKILGWWATAEQSMNNHLNKIF